MIKYNVEKISHTTLVVSPTKSDKLGETLEQHPRILAFLPTVTENSSPIISCLYTWSQPSSTFIGKSLDFWVFIRTTLLKIRVSVIGDVINVYICSNAK